jgi:Cu/Ag efflux protein CusF
MRKSLALALGLMVMALASSSSAAQKEQTNAPPPNAQRNFGGPPLMGIINSVGVDRFEIKKADGSAQTVMVDEHTRYRQGQQDIQLEDLKPGDHVFVRGQANANQELVAEGVTRVTDQEMQRFQNMGDRTGGAIVSIDKNQIKVSTLRQGEKIITVNEQTQFVKDGQSISLQDLKVGDRIFATGKETQGQFLATRIMTGQFRGAGRRQGNQ